MIPAPSVPEGKDKRDENRDQTFIALYAGGATMEEIAELYGLTRERVRQVLERCGVTGRTNWCRAADPSAVMAAIRRPGVMTWGEAAKLATADINTARKIAAGIGCLTAANRLFRWRQSAAARRSIISGVRALAARLGRTPSVAECNANQIFQTSLETHFGSRREAMRACGLVPRGPGEYTDTARRHGPKARTRKST